MSPPSTAPARRAWQVPAVVLGVAALLVAVILLQQRGTGDADAGASDTSTVDDPSEEGAAGDPAGEADSDQPDLRVLERRDPEDPLSAGPVDAPVGLVVYSDYQCPYCASWSEETLPALMEYVDAGDLRIEWQDLNIFGEASERASRASYAAGLQDRFWDYHHGLFPDGDTRAEADLGAAALIDLAEELDLDVEQFTADMDAPETVAEIEDNAQLGLDIGVQSTPAFVLDGQPIVGAQPTDVFTEAVDDALAGTED